MKILSAILLSGISITSFAEIEEDSSSQFLLDNEYTSIEIIGSFRSYEGITELELGSEIKAQYLITPNIYAIGSYERTKISSKDFDITIKGQALSYGLGVRQAFLMEADEVDVFAYFNLMNTFGSISDSTETIKGNSSAYEIGAGYSIKPGAKPELVMALTLFMNKYKDFEMELSDFAYTVDMGYDINPNFQAKMVVEMSFSFDDPKFGIGVKGKL
ncbi:MAG: hypothetical protein HRU38_19935 [Saccharospirillaceae bacterium]|nr:hypothetical protein [Pseudomonadales bacterium]NRB80904.1 hypothetical protein [Saccharospirillaceae bacterium]